MARQPKRSDDGKLNIPQGTLELLILTIVRREPLHGYGIAQRLKSLTCGTFEINPGSLFPALYALERDGKLRCEERLSDNSARRVITCSRRAGARSSSARSGAGSASPPRSRACWRAHDDPLPRSRAPALAVPTRRDRARA